MNKIENIQGATSLTDHRTGQLKAILYLLQTNLEEFKDEVDRSYELLKLGEKTDLSQRIESSLDNPIESIFGMSANIDGQVKLIIDRIVKGFLKKHHGTIELAFRSKFASDDLHYCLVLKSDNSKERGKIFRFFDRYDLLDIAQRYPVIFQFVPQELAGKIEYSEILDLSK
jgi:hypothetical protein